jgi:hypothetical protein
MSWTYCLNRRRANLWVQSFDYVIVAARWASIQYTYQAIYLSNLIVEANVIRKRIQQVKFVVFFGQLVYLPQVGWAMMQESTLLTGELESTMGQHMPLPRLQVLIIIL